MNPRLTESFFSSLVLRPSPKTHLHDDTGVAGNTGPQLGSLLADGTSDSGALHLTLGVDDLQMPVRTSSTLRQHVAKGRTLTTPALSSK